MPSNFYALILFQSTRPRGARPIQTYKFPRRSTFQSTRPRGARHRAQCTFCESSVSIHAPAGGATIRQTLCFYLLSCFNPRARGGRDRESGDNPSLAAHCFNPRARGGRDALGVISTSLFTCFNPRARGGRDARNYWRKWRREMFQSTRPRGARR